MTAARIGNLAYTRSRIGIFYGILLQGLPAQELGVDCYYHRAERHEQGPHCRREQDPPRRQDASCQSRATTLYPVAQPKFWTIFL